MLGVSLSGPCRNLGESKAKVRADEATDARSWCSLLVGSSAGVDRFWTFGRKEYGGCGGGGGVDEVEEEEEEEDMKLDAAEEANPFAMFSLTNSPQLHKAGTSHPHFADVYLVIRLGTISLPGCTNVQWPRQRERKRAARAAMSHRDICTPELLFYIKPLSFSREHK